MLCVWLVLPRWWLPLRLGTQVKAAPTEKCPETGRQDSGNQTRTQGMAGAGAGVPGTGGAVALAPAAVAVVTGTASRATADGVVVPSPGGGMPRAAMATKFWMLGGAFGLIGPLGSAVW